MPEDWTAVAADVTAALAEVGMSATLIRQESGPTTPWDVASVIAGDEETVTIVVENYDLRQIDGTLIRAQDRRVMMAAAVAPTEKDRLVIAGETYQIVSIRTLAPGGVALLFEVQARK